MSKNNSAPAADSVKRDADRMANRSQSFGGDHAGAVQAVFDEWARTGKADGMERRHKRLAELMLGRFNIPRNARVLDIGCGYGWIARVLAHRVPDGAIVGIDPSLEMIFAARQAYERVPNALFAPAAAEEIPWAEDYFTHVISIESAYYWTQTSLASKEIYRVTAYGGSFHILINYFSGNPYSRGWDGEMGLPLHRLTDDQWAAVFRDAGFGGVTTERIPDDSPISPGKTPGELARRQGLQRIGALYVTGSKPALPETPSRKPVAKPSPFRIWR